MLAQFFPKYGLRRAIFNNFADFFSELQYDNKSHKYFYNIPTYLNKNQQENPSWVELKSKIWPNSTINEAPLTWPASPWEN